MISSTTLQLRNNFPLAPPLRLSSLPTGADEENYSASAPKPPVPFRDENSFVFAGDLPNEANGDVDDSPPPLRQSKFSNNPLLSPPRPIPNPYGWMRDDSRTNTTVLTHLREENEYTRRMTQHLDDLTEELYEEFLSAKEETDFSTPAACGAYWYYSRFIEGLSYPIYCRAPRKDGELYHPPINERWNERGDDPFVMQPLLPGEQIYLNLPEIASTKKYLACGSIKISPDDTHVAYSLDEVGGETCQMYIKHIESGTERILYNGDKPLEGDGSLLWDKEGKALFFCTLDATHRPYRLYRRQIFDDRGDYIDDNKQQDELIFEEEDGSFSLRISKTFDLRYLLLTCSAKESTEIHYLDLESSRKGTNKSIFEQFVCISKRIDKLCYRVTSCAGGYWLVQTNNMGGTPNLSLKACKLGEEKDASTWLDVVFKGNKTSEVMFDGGDEKSLDGVTVFSPPDYDDAPLAYAVVTGREEGIPRIWILEFAEDDIHDSMVPLTSSPLHVTKSCRLEFDESAYDCGIGGNRDNNLPYVVVAYDSLTQPPSHIAIPLSNPENLSARKVLKEKLIEGYNKQLFGYERFTITSRDDVEIPVSMVFQRDTFEKSNGDIPVHLYGYGSYGASIEASFRSTRLPLLKRGVVYVLAHVRGGGELGRPWYEDQGKYLGKKNTFNDFIDIARWLTDKNQQESSHKICGGITNPSRLSCEGRSAGGLLIGASLNQAPDLFRAAILGVPFVDLMCTMIDSTIPLTIQEWQEWGCPNEAEYHDYMMSYCPMQNVQEGKTYPSCLITGGLHDPRVAFWEPAKFCATLRHGSRSSLGPILLKTDIDAGHFAQSDRYKYLKEQAYEYAYLLEQLGLVDT